MTTALSFAIVGLVLVRIPASGAEPGIPPETARAGSSPPSISRMAFRPAMGESILISAPAGAAGAEKILVYDASECQVRSLALEASAGAAKSAVLWDGRDWSGRLVPDGAYTFAIEGRTGLVYDPYEVSGGKAGDIKAASFDREAGTIAYSLPSPARVLIRFGIQGGPMLRTLVDWEPRVAGSILEHWDGWDEDRVIRLWGAKGFTALITYVTLPDATVITYGNTNETYREYMLGRGRDRPRRPENTPVPDNTAVPPEDGKVRPVGLLPPAWSRSPKVLLSFPALGAPVRDPTGISGTVAVRVDVDPSDKEQVAKDQFEVIFYVDNVFFAEAERGYLPYNFPWETASLPEGEHVLTVNISSFRGQVGVASRKVRVQKAHP